MKHYGDITKLSGYDLPVVDIITGGSPCQDLSVAGKRAGLAGERSGLFMEQIRIVKEMRERDRESGRTAWAVRPRYMVWENVPGAFSSGKPKGADFAAVIEEIIKVADPDADVCVCVPDRGWTKSGCYYAEDGSWSIAWRVHDAQFWGVPQRRKRIALVADFGGLSAPEILFERKGLSGDTEPGGAPWQGAAAGAEGGTGSTGTDVISFDPAFSSHYAGTYYRNVAKTITPANAPGFHDAVSYGVDTESNHIPVLYDAYQHHGWRENETCGPLTAGQNDSIRGDTPIVAYALQAFGEYKKSNTASSCKMRDFKDATDLVTSVDCRNGTEREVVCVFDKEMYNCGEKMGGVPQARYDNVAPTVRADSHPSGVCTSTVRRLTPLECERLQGFPDGWTDIGEWTDSKGKLHKDADSPRYKALGNSIALPFWAWLARRICAQYERPMTMASLFDGIGGFPLVFSRAGAVPVWASEIEEFPIAVTKRHFPEEEPHEA